MQIESWIAYLAVAAVATAIPGPAVLLVSSRCLELGLKKCIGVICGNVTGLFLLCLLSAFGLTAVLMVSSFAFTVLKLAGATYLIYLGVRTLRRAGNHNIAAPFSGKSRPSDLSVYAEGVLLAISNPKAVLFTTALFPQFIDRSMPLLPQLGVMAFTLMGLSFICLFAYACAVNRFGKQFARLYSKHVQRLFGGAYILAGTSLALTSK